MSQGPRCYCLPVASLSVHDFSFRSLSPLPLTPRGVSGLHTFWHGQHTGETLPCYLSQPASAHFFCYLLILAWEGRVFQVYWEICGSCCCGKLCAAFSLLQHSFLACSSRYAMGRVLLAALTGVYSFDSCLKGLDPNCIWKLWGVSFFLSFFLPGNWTLKGSGLCSHLLVMIRCSVAQHWQRKGSLQLSPQLLLFGLERSGTH